MPIRPATPDFITARVRRTAALVLLVVSAGPIPAQNEPPSSKYRIDKDRLHFAGIRDDERVLSEGENAEEFRAYNAVCEIAHQFPASDLEPHARRDVSPRDLMSRSRGDYRLELIYLEGKLSRLKRLKPAAALSDVGVTDLYEGWIFPSGESDPVCVVLTESPVGITPSLKVDPQPRVRFAGYSFKVIRYESEDPDATNPARGKMRRAPLLIGKSLTVIPQPSFEPGQNWQGTFVPILLGGLGALAVVGFGLGWWFRRGDRAVRVAGAGRTRSNPFEAVSAGEGPA